MREQSGLQTDRTIGEALSAFAHDILREARVALEDRTKSEAVAVHDFRKAMKRWRAFLRLLEPIMDSDVRQLRHRARDLGRGLSAARDGQSALDAIADLMKTGESLPERTWASICRRLDALREDAERAALGEEMRERLAAAVEEGRRAVEHWPLDTITFGEIADGLARGYARARRAVPSNWMAADAEELHALRQQVIVHRYQMPLIGPLWPRLGKVWTGETQRLRDRLGACQDLTVLAALTETDQALASWRSRLLPLVEARRQAHVAAAERLAGRLFAERPKAFRRRLGALWDAARPEADDADDP